ncbi:alpha/beta fold hydrolase [Lentzea sp. NPDC006480]|uniref:alpha/beta hydrolase n=1 Tax=Lentzea sp. NPDC006480 TaxID=3157176 RepID=UPI00339F702F
MPTRTAETQQRTTVRTHDGLRLAGTLAAPEHPEHAVLLLHGEGSNREQDGFYPRLATELADRGVASLRFDLPGHGESEGRQDELTLSGLLNTINAGLTHLREHVADAPATLLATGLTGGVAAGYAARKAPEVAKLVLVNPMIDYDVHLGALITDQAGRDLITRGQVEVTPTFAVGRAMLNEVFWLQPRGALGAIAAPTLILHGAGPTDVPLTSSTAAADALTCEHRFVEITGPQSAHWQAPAIREATEWILS